MTTISNCVIRLAEHLKSSSAGASHPSEEDKQREMQAMVSKYSSSDKQKADATDETQEPGIETIVH